jgi:hypothetical protein
MGQVIYKSDPPECWFTGISPTHSVGIQFLFENNFKKTGQSAQPNGLALRIYL